MPKILLAHRGSILTGLSIIAVFLALAVAGYMSGLRPTSPSRHHRFTQPTSAEMAMTLGRLGLDPDTLAAAGASAQQTSALVSAARSHLATHMDDLRTADAACSSAQHTRDRLRDLVQSGLASQQDRDSFPGAKTALTTALAQRQSALDAAFTAATAGLSEPQVSAINTIRANRGRDLPTRYLASARSEADWFALREALDNVRIAALRGESPNEAAQSLVSSADSASTTPNANLQAYTAAVNAAWSAAVGL